MSDLVYGVVVAGVFHSGRMERSCVAANGIYSMDMSVDDFPSTLSPANLSDAVRYFRKSSRMQVVRGISFKDGMIPENPVSFPAVPIGVIDPTYDDFEEVEVVQFGKDSFYFIQTVETQKAYVLMEIKAALEERKQGSDFKGASPEMRIAYALHLADIAAERKRKEEQEPANAVKVMMEEVGAAVDKVIKTNRGFEVTWKLDKYRFVTIFDKQLKVVNAGYCVRQQDKVLSPRSIVNVLKDGIKQHGDDGMIHATLAYDRADFDDDPGDDWDVDDD